VKRDPIRSSLIASIGYDAEVKTLEIGFANGSVYQYFMISAGICERLRAAGSIGAFFNTHIRDAYPSAQVWDSVDGESSLRSALTNSVQETPKSPCRG
jgi:hypothetical protein